MNPCKHGIIVTDCFSCAACDKKKIQDLTNKVQYLLDAYIPNKTIFQYMFPDGDVWIVRPKETPMDVATIHKPISNRLPWPHGKK
ncbi:MAG TPA: hypothetical protein ENI23_09255 [bacterium]|nr:hypothetical protein [bacterium]